MDFNSAVAHLCGEEWEATARVGTRLREDVLSALLPASRTEDGRLALGAAPGAIEAIARPLRDPLACLEPAGLLSARLLRNLCARSQPNQQRAAAAGAHLLVLECVRCRIEACNAIAAGGDGGRVPAALRRIEGDEHEGAVSGGRLRLPFFSAAVEFLCNFATCNPANANLVWDRAFPELFFEILECDNAAACAAGAALLHNCIAATPERASDVVRIWAEGDGRGRRSLAESLVRKLHGEEEGDLGGAGESFSWAFMVIRRLVGAGLVENVFNVVGPPLREIARSVSPPVGDIVDGGGPLFSPYQMTLLGVLEAAVDKSAESLGRARETDLRIPDSSLQFFAQLMSVAWQVRDGTACRLAASIAGSLILLAPDADSIDEMKQTAMSVAVDALVTLQLHTHKGGVDITSSDGRETSGTDAALSITGLRGAAVRFVAIAANDDREMQDLVRDMSGITPILSALSYEKDVTANPFLREWAVMAVRNLCLGNEENASVISSLELVDVQANEGMLNEAGLEAFMGSDGRPRLRVKGGMPS